MNMTVMGDDEVTEADHRNPIDAIEKNYEDLFLVSVGLGAPSAGAVDAAKKAHQGALFHMNKVLSMPTQEIEAFMDSLTELVTKEAYPEKASEYRKQIDAMGAIGGVLGSIERSMRSLNDEQLRTFVRESLKAASSRVDALFYQISREIMSSGSSDSFDYLITAQAIFFKSRKMIDEVAAGLEKGKDLDKSLMDLYVLAIFALIRVEAFRRGKIALSDLRDTYTILLTVSPSDLITYGIRWTGPIED